MSAAPVPSPTLPPVRPAGKGTGCLPFAVFLLTVAGACGIGALRLGLLPTEDAGRVVMEILDEPSKDEMKSHAERIRSAAVLDLVIKNLNAAQSSRGREEFRQSLRHNLAVKVNGPFLTITVHEYQDSQIEMASAMAQAYDQDLKEETETGRKLVGQNLQARMTIMGDDVEKARLEWLDIMQKHNLRPDGGSIIGDATLKEIAARLAKDTAALVEKENYINGLDAADGELAGKKAEAAALRAQITTWQKAAREQDLELLARLRRRCEMDEVKARYDGRLRFLQGMQEEARNQILTNGIVLRPTRIVEEARSIQTPDRRITRFVRLGTVGCAVLLAALLLTALATRLCRRA